MKTTKKIVALLMAMLIAFSVMSVSLTAVAATRKVTKITLNKTKDTIYTNEKLTLKAKVTPSNATNKKVKWSTSSSKIATVSSSGVVTPKKEGKVTITCTAADGSKKKATCVVTVKKFVKVTAVKLNATSKSIYVGKTATLKATVSPSNATEKDVKWSTSSSKIATVSSKGVVKGIKAGTATITCKATDGSGKKSTCKVTVKNRNVSEIELNKTSTSIYIGKSTTLQAAVSPADATNLTLEWTTSDKSIATVSTKGVVKGVKAGTATITCKATDGSGVEATCKVTVKSRNITKIELDKTSVSLYPGKSAILNATVTPSDATNKTLKWTSSDTTAATVTSDGIVKGVTAGKTATITCKATDGSGVEATCKVTVGAYAKAITITSSGDFEWYVGKTAKLTANFEPSYTLNKKVTWSSSDTKYATVDANGNVKILKTKTNFLGKPVDTEVTITATAADGSGVKGTYTVKILKEFKDVTSISFPSSVADMIFIGEKVSFKALINPKDASERGITYSTSDKTVATVDKNGNVTALKEGKVTITATSTYDTKITVSKEVTVSDFTLSCILSKTNEFYTVGEVITAYCLTTPSEARPFVDCHIEVEDKNIATVISDSLGFPQIKFTAAGNTRLRAASDDGRVVSEWRNIEVIEEREFRTENDFFEEKEKGDLIYIDIFLYRKDTGERIAENAARAAISCYLSPYEEYFELIENGYGKYALIIKEELPEKGAKVTFKAMNGSIVKEIYFSPNKYQLPSGTKAELLGKFKNYSADALGLRSAESTKTVTYSDLNIDKNNSKTELSITFPILGIPTKMSLTEFIDWLGKQGEGTTGSEGEEAEGLLGELSPEFLIGDLFSGTQTSTATVYDRAAYPQEITVGLADVKDVEVIDNGGLTYKMKLTLNDMTEAKALNLIGSSAYGKTMKIIDEAYMSGYGDNLDLSGSDIGGTNTSSSLTWNAINQKYSDGYVVFTVNKLTDKVVESEYHYKSNINVDKAKFLLSTTVSSEELGISFLPDLTLGIDLIAYFTMNIDSTTKYTAIKY